MTPNRILATFGKVRRGRLLLLLVLCVLLPTIPLGYLIMRSMVGESEGISRRITGDLERAGDALTAATTAAISQCENRIEGRLKGDLTLEETVAGISEELNGCPVFESFFLLDSSLKPLFPFGEAGGDIPEIGLTGEVAESFVDEIRDGYLLEFDSRDLEGAIRKYEMALAYARGSEYRGVVENAMARCCAKRGEDQKAKSLYSAIIEEPGPNVMYGGLSLRLLARYRLAEIEARGGNSQEAAVLYLSLLSALARGELAGSAYEAIFYASRIEEKLAGLLAGDELPRRYERKFEEARGEWRRRMKTALEMTELPESALLDFRKFLGRREKNGEGFRTLSMAIQGRETTLLYEEHPLAGIDGAAIIAIVVDPAVLREQVRGALDDVLASEADMYASVYDSTGRLIGGGGDEAPSSEYQIERSLAPSLPDWRLTVAYRKGGLLFEVAERERMTRMTSIFFLASIIFLGLYVAHRSIRRDTELARLKSDFVSRVSHELRTPLATIRALGEMLEMGAVSSREKEREYFSLIASESERLSRLIDNVLDFSKIGTDRKTYTFRPADIEKTVSTTVLAFSQYVRSEGFDINFEADDHIPPIEIDEDAISQALINLLDNAVKFSRQEKTIRIELRKVRDEVRISVRDRGAGIDAEVIDKIFDQFYRPKEAVEFSSKGAGIGLAIVKHVAEAHGGKVEVESRKGKGSTFVLVLPAGGKAE